MPNGRDRNHYFRQSAVITSVPRQFVIMPCLHTQETRQYWHMQLVFIALCWRWFHSAVCFVLKFEYSLHIRLWKNVYDTFEYFDTIPDSGRRIVRHRQACRQPRSVVKLRGGRGGLSPWGPLKDLVAPSKHLVWEGTKGPVKARPWNHQSNSIHDCNISVSL